MTKITARPRWLKKEGGEWEWAYRYMQQQATERGIKIAIKRMTWRKKPCHELVAETISYLQDTSDDGGAFVTRLRNALRQHRHRSLNAGKEKKPYSFTLPTETKKALRAVAKRQKKSEAAVITDLLSGTEQLINDHQAQEQKLKKMHAFERKVAEQRIDILKVKHHEAMRQIQMLVTRLSIWEVALESEHPDIIVDQEALEATEKKTINKVKSAIKKAVDKHTFLQPRIN
ncbi:hypothetical protein [Pseudomonas abietaniphila]|uniref:Uncharacterized protein n=1 Tax=Pseudomonas abietaniphila TaxID=89065 RepID=A0A1G8TZ79_9PSED|nr:hypothetical protein [Pseudomonas abietaniphila]SDJ46886.1 hypothetical protein SAMN05216605_13129 [Pseudomonas abietaniphila]